VHEEPALGTGAKAKGAETSLLPPKQRPMFRKELLSVVVCPLTQTLKQRVRLSTRSMSADRVASQLCAMPNIAQEDEAIMIFPLACFEQKRISLEQTMPPVDGEDPEECFAAQRVPILELLGIASNSPLEAN